MQIPENEVHCPGFVWKNYGMYVVGKGEDAVYPVFSPFPIMLFSNQSFDSPILLFHTTTVGVYNLKRVWSHCSVYSGNEIQSGVYTDIHWITSSLYHVTSSLYHVTLSFYHGTSSLYHVTFSFYHVTSSLYHVTFSFYHVTSSLYHVTFSFYHVTLSLYHVTFSFLLRMTTPSSMAASRFKYNT